MHVQFDSFLSSLSTFNYQLSTSLVPPCPALVPPRSGTGKLLIRLALRRLSRCFCTFLKKTFRQFSKMLSIGNNELGRIGFLDCLGTTHSAQCSCSSCRSRHDSNWRKVFVCSTHTASLPLPLGNGSESRNGGLLAQRTFG